MAQSPVWDAWTCSWVDPGQSWGKSKGKDGKGYGFPQGKGPSNKGAAVPYTTPVTPGLVAATSPAATTPSPAAITPSLKTYPLPESFQSDATHHDVNWVYNMPFPKTIPATAYSWEVNEAGRRIEDVRVIDHCSKDNPYTSYGLRMSLV